MKQILKNLKFQSQNPKLIYISIFLILVLTITNLVNAQIVECKETPCSWQDFAQSFSNLIRTVVIISFWIAFLIVAIGAFLVMFAGPSESLYKQGLEMIKTAIWGYILILLSGVVIDVILEFFSPQFKQPPIPKPKQSTILNFALAQTPTQTPTLTPVTYFNPLKAPIMSALKCGQNAEPIFRSPSLGRIFACLFESIGLLRNVAIVLLVGAIIWAAIYLITTPLFGLKQISRAYKILIWSTIGLIIILLAELIRAQIERIVR